MSFRQVLPIQLSEGLETVLLFFIYIKPQCTQCKQKHKQEIHCVYNRKYVIQILYVILSGHRVKTIIR